MKKYLIILNILLSAVFASCSNDIANSDQATGDKINLTLVGETNPTTRATVQLSDNNTVGTRTSFTGTFPNSTAGSVTFKWEANDNIKLLAGTQVVTPSKTTLTPGSTSATFEFTGVTNLPTYTVYYNGTNGTGYNGVNIAATQTQSAANNSQHLGASGDCGISTITAQGGGNYSFTLNHKSSYLCFLPYNTATGETNGESKITKIVVTSDTPIAGAYTLNTDGSLTGGAGKSITLNLPSGGFPVYNSLKQATNACYMVIAPGSHALTITYTIVVGTNTRTVTQTVASTAFSANTVYTIQKNVKDPTIVYFNSNYHEWDAQQYIFTSGTAWPTTGSTDPQKLEYGNTSTTGTVGVNLDKPANAISLNQAYSYVTAGGAYWDENQKWVLSNGISGQAGIWLLKSVNISGFGTTAPVWNGTAATATITNIGTPTDKTKYFFLPAAGYYQKISFTVGSPYKKGLNTSNGTNGSYWISDENNTNDPTYGYTGYSFMFERYGAVGSTPKIWMTRNVDNRFQKACLNFPAQ